MKKGIFLFCLYGILVLTAFTYREPLMDWLNRSDANQLPIMFFLGVLFGVIPIVPFSVFAGMMGAKYGILIGAAVNWIGSVGAAIIFFILTRYFFVHQFQQYITRYNKIKKFDEIISENAFVAVLFSRMLPIIPPPIVNIYSGLSAMKFSVYLLATAIGQIPGMLVYAYLGNQIFASIQSFLFGILLYIAFLLVVLPIYRWWYKGI
ncbi:TVP38/TMEM64 family protein [Salinibacillus xinjiangensis]|uniref:TVP38/TMEM64 family membrane protein n=1 Tax=Salinibacillus xinjiangensis TaxID=1229268 RepID=A0A6G1X9Z8_9BACI|nr:VTT domain-containing protein [Salinibacillus xinjiangensis]MRG87804.1 TVP38/TMEM64 family protein [Salinibacillus xinjiangensis]